MIYPEIGGRFEPNRDVVDRIDKKTWVFPSSCIPKSALKKQNILLVVDPDDLEVTSRTVTVLSRPEKVVVLSDFLVDGGAGVSTVSDKLSGVALRFLPSAGAVAWPRAEKLLRHNFWGVRPMARNIFGFGTEVYACADSDAPFAVSYAKLSGLVYDSQLTFTDCLELLRCANITPTDLNLLLGMIRDNVELFSNTVRPISPEDVSSFLSSSKIPTELKLDLALKMAISTESDDSAGDSNPYLRVCSYIVRFVTATPSALDAPRSVLDLYSLVERRFFSA
jgi:hypothetical protein